MRGFCLDSDKKCVIYGAGGNAYRLIKILKENCYTIIAVIDMRAKDIQYLEGIPVYTLLDFNNLNIEKEECVIFITVKNVFEHINIVRELLGNGYENIVYKPYTILQGMHDEDWDSIDRAYECLVEKNQLLDKESCFVAKSQHERLMIYTDKLCIEKSDEAVKCWLPIELLCNYDREDAFKLIPMGAFYPILNLYQYLLSKCTVDDWDVICEEFLLYSGDWIKKTGSLCTDSLKKRLLQSRVAVFGEMQKKADIDKQFFLHNSVQVKRNGSVFSLTSSGRNRVAFLIAKGYRYIPVEMSLNDYTEWFNELEFHKFIQFL